ncbi:MAG: hypothetical protein U9R47_01995, partial [Actinomycetota bacterium]|nr:hypothetical protein [Actinomycetota bacterium]
MTGSNVIKTGAGQTVTAALVFLFGTAATLGTVLGFFGATWWGFDRLANWRFPYIVILLVTAVIYGFVFRRALSALFLLAAVTNAVLLAPMWLAMQPVATSSDGIRVVSLDTGGSSENRLEIVEWINQEEADVALIHRSSGDWATTLDVSGVPYRIVATPVASDAAGRTLLLVRHNATASPLVPVPGADVTVSVANEGISITMIGLAVQNPGSTSAADDRIERFTAVNTAALGLEGPVVVTGNLEAS